MLDPSGWVRLPAVLCLALVTALSLGLGVSVAAPDRSDLGRSDLDRARERLMALERDFQLVVEHYNLVSERLTGLQLAIAAAELEVGDIERRMVTRRRAAVRLATELYKGGRELGIEGVLSASSLTELETRVGYLQTSTAAQSNVFERLAVDRIELDKKIEALDEQRAAALAAQVEVEALRRDIESKVEAQEAEVADLRAAIEASERRAAAAARRAASAAPIATVIGSQPARPAPAPNARAQAAVDAALSQLGKPYHWGGSGPDSYDCSGLTMWAWARAGVGLPHNSGAQYGATVRVGSGDWEPGDLLFFGNPIHHVGMYIGNGQMVEAPYSGNSVRVNSASRSDYVGAGRPGV
jgi:cell wall-associated NlpC family hydrolase